MNLYETTFRNIEKKGMYSSSSAHGTFYIQAKTISGAAKKAEAKFSKWAKKKKERRVFVIHDIRILTDKIL